MHIGQVQSQRPRTRRSTRPGSDGRQHGDPASARPARSRGRRGGEAGAARPRRDAARRAGGEPDGAATASSRAAAGRSPTAQLLGDKLFNMTMPAAPRLHAGRRRRRSRSASTRSSARSRAADRHPGQGRAATTSTSTTSGCRGCSTAASCGRAARVPYGAGDQPIVSVDESSIKHIPGAQVVRKRLPRRRRAEGVRRDPGCGAAEGDAGRSDADAPGHRATSGSRCGSTTAPARRRASGHARTPGTSTRRSRRRRSRLGDATSTTTSGHRPDRPAVRVADVTLERRARSSRTRQSIPGVPSRGRTRSLGLGRRAGAGVLLRGRELVRRRAERVDVAMAAAVMSQLIGKPVRMQLMRWDEHGWDSVRAGRS